jgi:Leucine-rich repeat (LRR) protein
MRTNAINNEMPIYRETDVNHETCFSRVVSIALSPIRAFGAWIESAKAARADRETLRQGLAEWTNEAGITSLERTGRKKASKLIMKAYVEKWQSLTLVYMSLSRLPPQIGRLTHLSELILYNNALTDLPPEMANLEHLRTLILSNNHFTRVPASIRQLTFAPEGLEMDGNLLPILPPEDTYGAAAPC